jgi:hypothetical protein
MTNDKHAAERQALEASLRSFLRATDKAPKVSIPAPPATSRQSKVLVSH